MQLARLWVFGDAHEVPMLQNVVSDIFIEKLRHCYCLLDRKDIIFIWENALEGCALRQIILDINAVSASDAIKKGVLGVWSLDPFNGQHAANTWEALVTFAKWVEVRGARNFNRRKCCYHVHKVGETCKSLG